jgi:hypothetical protein
MRGAGAVRLPSNQTHEDPGADETCHQYQELNGVERGTPSKRVNVKTTTYVKTDAMEVAFVTSMAS